MNIELFTEPFNIDAFKMKINNILIPFDVDIESLIKDSSLDPEKIKVYLSKFTLEDRYAMNYIISKIKHISWIEFKANFIELATDIKNEIKGDYGFLLTSETQYHSESFFTALAYKEVFSKWKDPIFCGFNNNITNNIIYTDDGSYSGTQLIDTLIDFINVQKNIYSNKPTEFQVIFLNRNVDLPTLVNNSDYFISINTSKNLYGFYSKSSNKKYISSNTLGVLDFKLVLQLMNDLNNFKKLHVKPVYIKEGHIIKYLDIDKIRLLNNIINIWICIPYISEESFKKLYDFDKKNSKYFKIHFTDPFKYRLYDIIQDAPESLKQKVIELLQKYMLYYSKYLKQTEINLKVISLLPIYFDHKISSIVSTLSVIIGCGIVISSDGKIREFVGPLIKHCEKITKDATKKIETLLYNLYESYTIQQEDTQTCSMSPQPIYSLREKDIIHSMIGA